jgi:hypothetical protein
MRLLILEEKSYCAGYYCKNLDDNSYCSIDPYFNKALCLDEKLEIGFIIVIPNDSKAYHPVYAPNKIDLIKEPLWKRINPCKNI